MFLKHSLGASLQGFCHSLDSLSDGFWITSANFSFTHLRNISHAVTLPSVSDETSGLITTTTCVRMVCAASHGRSQSLSLGSTGDLSKVTPLTLGPQPAGALLPLGNESCSDRWGMADCDTGFDFFSFFFPFIWGQGFLIAIPEWLNGPVTAGSATKTIVSFAVLESLQQ